MGILSLIKNVLTFPFRIFRRKKEDLSPLETPPKTPLPKTIPEVPQIDTQKAGIEGVKIKLDLVLTELDNIKTQNQMLNERLKVIERKMEEKRIRYI